MNHLAVEDSNDPEVTRLTCQGHKAMTLAEAERKAHKSKMRIYRCRANPMEPPHWHVTRAGTKYVARMKAEFE